MIESNNLKFVKSLHDKKTRYKESLYLAEGSRLVLDLIKNEPNLLSQIFASSEWIALNEANLVNFRNIINELSISKLNSIASLKSTNEVLAIVKMPSFDPNFDLSQVKTNFYLDRIQDPGNLGTIIRTADWFGLKILFHSPQCADPFNNKCVQASMSSISRIKLIECEPDELRSKFGFEHLVATSLKGPSYKNFEIKPNSIICLGNEAHGLSNELLILSDESICIPSSSIGAESLNVGVSAGILMSEFIN